MDAYELIDKVKAFDVQSGLSSAGKSEAFLSEVVDANRDQWELGENSKGEKIGRYESPEYAQFKYEQNSRAGRGNVDLMLTHDLERNMFAKAEGDGIVIDSGDWKSDMLQERYGKEIFGVNDNHKEDISYVLQQQFIKEFEAETGL